MTLGNGTTSNDLWTLGDRTVRRIGFGTKRLAGTDTGTSTGTEGGPTAVRDRAAALLIREVELGVNHVDTAAFYPTLAGAAPERGEFTALGWANELLREVLAPYPDDLVIATKVGPTDAGMARPDQLRGLVEADLQALGRDRLDLVYLRQQGLDSVTEHVEVLAGLREEGLVRHLGISNVRVDLLEEALEIAPVVAVQNRYGVDFGRINDALLRTCGERGIAFVPFFTLTAAARESGGVAGNDVVAEVARRHGATESQVRLAWTLARGPHVLVIPGTSDVRHLEDNVAAGALRLSSDELDRLDRLSEPGGASR